MPVYGTLAVEEDARGSMPAPKWIVVYANVHGTWQPMGQAWEGQGGEDLAAKAYAQTKAPIYVYSCEADGGPCQGGMFDPDAEAAVQAARQMLSPPPAPPPADAFAAKIQQTVTNMMASLPVPAPGGDPGNALRQAMVTSLKALVAVPTADNLRGVIAQLASPLAGREANAVAQRLRTAA